jgi:tetratricopeptide (TPR) repeat protein
MKLAIALAASVFAAAPSALGTNPDPSLTGIGFICSAEQAGGSGGTLALMKDVGNGRARADTSNPEAQAWFENALDLYHAFSHDETKAAFAKAAALDPTCAMCAWGVAMSLGPTLNTQMTDAERVEALAIADRAATLVKPGDTRTAGLIATLQGRYAREPAAGGREMAYGKALDALLAKNPGDDMIANLAAHALITPARQDDYSGVPRAIAILEAVLAKKPDDTAAIHYYIHATEFAQKAPLALPYAVRLDDLAPGAAHLVHMGTHTLMRVGRYEDVAVTNAQALKVDAETRSALGAAAKPLTQRYYTHNYLFGLSGALMAGDGPLAVKYAEHAAVAYPGSAPEERRTMAQARSLVALGRYAPDRALAVADDPKAPRLVKIYRRYARGEAYAARRDLSGVAAEAALLEMLIDEATKANETGNVTLATIARDVLAGRAAMLDGRPADAISYYTKAAVLQEKAFPVPKNFDPPPWWYPVRRSVAAAELKAGRKAQAAAAARASLAEWPHDPLALRVLAQADPKDAAANRDEARKVWRGDLAKVTLDLT